MKITKGTLGDECIIYDIVYTTINEIYPKYYPEDVVTFFINHHSLDNIRNALDDEIVLIIKVTDKNIGTGAILGNEIRRMFISFMARILPLLKWGRNCHLCQQVSLPNTPPIKLLSTLSLTYVI